MRPAIQARAMAWAVIVLCVTTLAYPARTLAGADISTRWDVMYATRSASHSSAVGCKLCHGAGVESAANVNAYGNALKPLPLPTPPQVRSAASIDARLLAVEAMNSDGDPQGATNLEEILQGTQPGWTGSAPVTATLDPPPWRLSINNVSASEGNGGTTAFTFTVTLSSARVSTVTVNYATQNGTAIAGTDYVAASGTLTFTQGVTSRTITVNVNGNTTVESDKTFFVNLSAPTNATIAVAQGTGTIINDDGGLSNANFEGLWWNSPAESESGWGINFAHQGDVIFATWFTYDTAGKAWWLTMTASKTGNGVYSGTLFQTKGPVLGSVPFTGVTSAQVGNGTLSFTSPSAGTFSYTVNGVTQTKAIVPQAFGPLPACVWGAQADLTKATNYQDLWWAAPAESESGWGVNLTQQGTTIFATWFTYDVNRNPVWYSATAAATATAPNRFTGTLYRTSGPAFSAVPFNPKSVQLTAVGTATFTFTNGNAGTFAYQVNDGPNVATQTKSIVRQVFRPPGTVCQ
jgi:hypothetical protein